jgi:hypothetical protein
MRGWFGILLLNVTILTTILHGVTLKNITVESEYKLGSKDKDALLLIQNSNTKIVKIIVPVESTKFDLFSSGTQIDGVSLTDGIVWIYPETSGVTILNSDEAYRTRKAGSKWTLIRLNKNFWLLEGDLYSLEIDSYIGDDVTIRANIDSKATGPFKFVWYKNGSLLNGQTQASLKLLNIKNTDAGNYRVEVSNSAGLIKSETTSLLLR